MALCLLSLGMICTIMGLRACPLKFQAIFSQSPRFTPSPSEALQKFLAAKAQAGFRPAYVKSLRQVVGRFLATNPVIATVDNVRSFIDAQPWCPAAKRGNIGRLASFFTYAVKQHWLDANPCDQIEMPRVADKIPFTFSKFQKRDILKWTLHNDRQMLGVLVVELILGVRPYETQRISRDCLQIQERRLVIDAAASKIWKRRIVPINLEAYRWLRLADRNGFMFPVSHSARRRFIRRLRNAMGFKTWPQDAMRHTAATNLLREAGDAGKVARWLGNSEKILLKNYADI